MKTIVKTVNEETIFFENGARLESSHDSDCCEHHWLSFKDLSLSDFEGLEFDLSTDSFFEKVEDYGIRLLPINGHPIGVPGYGSNNGYYSTELTLVLTIKKEDSTETRTYDITTCQVISG